MRDDNIREYIGEVTENALVFDNPDFDDSIIGVSLDGAVIYDYDSMVKELAKDDGISEEEAMEFIDYNTVRSIPYFANDRTAPIIIDSMSREIISDIRAERKPNAEGNT